MNKTPDGTLRPILCVVGARPNFMKMAPILRALAAHQPPIPALLVHTGQHYDEAMSDQLFADLKLPRPDINLEVGSASHAVQTANVMLRFEPLIDAHDPSCVLVVGDVNSTLACALVASKRGVPVAHVEAGLRSYDRAMPEETNRVLTDQISDRLYTTERSALDNLVREGIDTARVCFVGNVMIDSLLAHLVHARLAAETLESHGAPRAIVDGAYGVVTLHRPSNVDDPAVLAGLLGTLDAVGRKLPLVFALHPRTRANIAKFDLTHLIDPARTAILPPLGYLEMLGLMKGAAVVLTDSGGLQEETTALGVPCLTLRQNTERPVTIAEGTNTLVGIDGARIQQEVDLILRGVGKSGRIPEGWDGQAAKRISEDLFNLLSMPAERGA